ncbi:MAG: ABC transporter ATP-binding protein [Azospirillaceae bacterium]
MNAQVLDRAGSGRAAFEQDASDEAVLSVRGLKTHFFTEDGVVKSVDGVDLDLAAGKTLGVVGESGCGKSVTALSVMRLIQKPGRIVAGEIRFNGEDLLVKSDAGMRAIRGNEIAMIFQEPMTSLNPVFTVGFQIGEVIKLHRRLSRRAVRAQAIEMLRMVGIPSPELRVDNYPHELSGGMRQRVMIAMALSCSPKLLIADEPTTALDVTIQAQILGLLKSLQRELSTAVMLITHDLGVIAEVADEVAVMYCGRVVEHAPVELLFERPVHPYTRGLLRSTPRLDLEEDERLREIKGSVPSPYAAMAGCAFAPRCERATQRCHNEMPDYRELEPKHWVRCWYGEEILAGQDGNSR